MPNTDEGITNDEPQHDWNSDEGFRRALEAQAGGADLIHSKSEWGAPGSEHRKAKVASEMAEGQRKADAQIASLADFQAVITAPGAGNVQAGLQLPPDDAPEAPAPIVDTSRIEAVQAELTTTRASLSEAQAWEAMQVARDSLEESVDEQDVLNTLAELRSNLSPDAWSQFTMESLGDGLLDPDEFALHNQVYASDRAFESAFDQAAKAQNEADALAKAQYEILEAEQKRLGLDDAAMTLHLQDMLEAKEQLGLDVDTMSREEYAEAVNLLSAGVAETRRAYASAGLQEQILGAGSRNTDEGLTIMGMPVSPREPIEVRLDEGRMRTHMNRGKPFDIAKGVMDADRQARSLGTDIDTAFRAAKRANDEKQARARRAGL